MRNKDAVQKHADMAAANAAMKNAERIADEMCDMLSDYPAMDCGAALMMCMSRLITVLAHNNERTMDVEWRSMRLALDQMMTRNMKEDPH